MSSLRSGAPDLVAAALTDQGRRRPNNEDAFALQPERGLLLVSDGMGGHRAGEKASAVVVTGFPGLIEGKLAETAPADAKRVEESLRDAVVELSQELHRLSAADLEVAGLGATLVLLLFRGESAWVVNMGDSRAYRLRGGRLEALTEDHSLLAALVRRGFMSAEEAERRPGLARLTRYVGMEGAVHPDVRPETPEPGDRYLLCTDGLTGMLDEQAIASLLKDAPDPETACRVLVDAANAAGGGDNVTVIVADWRRPAA